MAQPVGLLHGRFCAICSHPKMHKKAQSFDQIIPPFYISYYAGEYVYEELFICHKTFGIVLVYCRCLVF